MSIRILSILFCLCWTFPALAGSIAGTVTDQKTGSPVAGAAVYVNNSTYTQICDAKGIFNLDRYPALPFDLVVSAVGYETGVLKITPENTGQSLNIGLQRKTINLDEVKVRAPEQDAWAKYGQRFTEELIGYSDFAAACKIANKEVVQFRYDNKDGILKAWTEQPLKIRNKATGYDITYWLDDFELDMFNNKLYYKGYAYFSALPASGKQAKRIEANRMAAFKGSFYHFVRALYQGRAHAEGFEIRVLKRVDEDKAGQYIPTYIDTLTWADTDRWHRLFSGIYGSDTAAFPIVIKALQVLRAWKEDTVKKEPLRLKGTVSNGDTTAFPLYVFTKMKQDNGRVVLRLYASGGESDARVLTEKKKLPGNVSIEGLPQNFKLPKQKMDVLFTAIIPDDSVLKRSAAPPGVILKFRDHLHITYTNEKEEMPYLKKRAGRFRKPAEPGGQTSILSLHDDAGIHLLEDGNFFEAYDLLLEQYWSYEKLDKLMPLDYTP